MIKTLDHEDIQRLIINIHASKTIFINLSPYFEPFLHLYFIIFSSIYPLTYSFIQIIYEVLLNAVQIIK